MFQIQFLSYDGSYPNLCRGVLVLKIDHEIYAFHSYSKPRSGVEEEYYWRRRRCIKENKSIHHIFSVYFESGGSCSYCGNNIMIGEWSIDFSEATTDKGVRFYIDDALVEEITAVFNKNVESGCCGGCI